LQLIVTDLFDALKNLIHVFFEPELEHLISFIEDDGLERFEIDVLSVDVIEHSACRSYKNVYAPSQLSDLIVNVDSAIHRHDSEFIFIVLELLKLFGYLKCKLTRRCKNDSLELPRA